MIENPTPATNNAPPKRGYDFGIGGGFIVLTTYRWASTIVQEWGWQPSQRLGIVMGMVLCFTIALLLADYLLWRRKLARAIRSGLWASAAIGPYVAVVAWEELSHPVWSQVTGLASTALVFITFYYLDQGLQHRKHESASVSQ
jgi:drug/metabolite transporter (DMT)-like permease